VALKGTENWTISGPVQQRVKAKIRGILTGCNEAFIIDGAKRRELLEKSPKNAEIIRPILRGRDIKRYSHEFADLYLLFIPWHFPLHNDPSITGASLKAEQMFENQYPAIYEHLLKHKTRLSNRNRAETGIRYEWYALQRWGANYWEDFFRRKLLYSEIVQQPQFYLDNDGAFFAEATTFIMTGQDLEYLCHLLHTKAVTHFFRTFYAGGGLGKGYRYKKAFLENLPIPPRPENIEINKDNAEEIVYELYGLSGEEADFVKSECG